MQDQRTERINIYSAGLVCLSVCAPHEMDQQAVEDAVNAESPTGIDSRWTVANEPFRTGEPNPFDAPDCGRHWLLTC